jgi:hypothetical protein
LRLAGHAPDLPGCAAEGDTIVEAVANVAGEIASKSSKKSLVRNKR